MLKYLNIIVLVIIGVIFQVNIFPAYLADPFKPNVLLVFVVYFGFRVSPRFGAPGSFLLGCIQDSFSGMYFGLNAFSFLLIFTLYHEVAARLYTGSRTLLVLGTALAIVINASIQFLLLLLFSSSDGAFASIFGSILPQGLATTLISACVVFLFSPAGREEFS
ncbi:MAG: rod shape-determining protein MreD [Geobacter sp.]|nr:MAG: rod shape-determining protein MreD [Geobacter sp.]